MGLLSRVNLKIFLLAFAVGLLVCYIMTPAPEVVVKFPSPYNAGKVVYKDKAGACFMYKADKSTCPRDQGQVKNQPIMEDFKTAYMMRGSMTM
jgi:hypothetical protein